MALTETEIKVIIAAELRKQGFDKASKATTGLEKTFKKLGKTIVSVFAVREIIRFGKASVNAFAEAEREAAQLRAQLTGINLEFATPIVDEYIDKLELLTGRSGGELTSAFNSLSRATEDVSTAQEIFNLALDVSAATGKDLVSVSTALQRAYKGETTALSRLRIGLTTAELKGKSFNQVVKELERRFGGSSLEASKSFGTSIDRLRRSVEQAQEAIGAGFVQGLKDSGKSIEETQKDIIALGEAVGKAAAAFTSFTSSMTKDISAFLNSSAYTKFRDAIDFLFRQANFVVTGEMLVPKASGSAAAQRRVAEERNRAELRQRNQLIKQEQKNATMRKKIAAEEEKRAKMDAARKRAQTIFDMENIQIVAALQGQVDGEQRMRLVSLLALNTQNYTAAEKLSDIVIRLNQQGLANLGVMIQAGDTIDDVVKKLITSQAKLAGLQLMAEDFPELDNPFEEWENSLEKILEMLMQLLGLTGKNAGIDYSKTSIMSPANQLASARYTALQEAIMSGNNPYARVPESIDFAQSSLASTTNQLAAQRYAARQQNVNVYVSGSVTTERDLVKSITDSLYETQRQGQSIILSSTGL